MRWDLGQYSAINVAAISIVNLLISAVAHSAATAELSAGGLIRVPIAAEAPATTTGANGDIGKTLTLNAVRDPKVQAQSERDRTLLGQSGYVERDDQDMKVKAILDYIEAKEAGVRPNGEKVSPAESGFFRGDIASPPDGVSLAFAPSTVPAEIRLRDSVSYVFPSRNTIMQVHTNTKFGNVLLEESRNTRTTFVNSNAVLAGEPGIVMDIRYKNNVWATAVVVAAGDRLIKLETDRRLEGAIKEEFVRLAEAAFLAPKARTP